MPWGVLFIVVLIGAGIFLRRRLRDVRRTRLMNSPFPAAWDKILKRNVSLYRRLPAALRRQLQSHILVLLAEKNFEGCGGLEMTDEIKVTIAAQAGILLLNKKPRYYPGLDSILVYPGTFVSQDIMPLGEHAYLEGETENLGESWKRGALILAWDAVKHAAGALPGGQNVVLHEFAHQLDQENGTIDGAPPLAHSTNYAAWARTLGKEYRRLQRETRQGLRSVMDEYGATDPAEFFAVATETFFETPRAMQRRHGELYAILADYYRLDPAAWVEESEMKQ
jgi:Mlc titration factor MtfA (ptsG expression regulator)